MFCLFSKWKSGLRLLNLGMLCVGSIPYIPFCELKCLCLLLSSEGAITRSLPRLNKLNTRSNLSIRSQRLTEDHMIIIIIMIIVSAQQVARNKAQTSTSVQQHLT